MSKRAETATHAALQAVDEGATESLAAIAAGIGNDSELVAAARQQRKRPENALGLLLRPLSKQEIAIMEARGCRADDWSLVQVAEDFDPFRVRRSHLVGRCVLGRFTGEVEVEPDIRLPTGVYDSTLIDCQVGNDCLIENVRFAAHVLIEREAVLFDVGSITCSGAATFACGQRLRLGPETGGRELPLWAEVDVAAAAAISRERGDVPGQEAVAKAVADYVDKLRSPVSWVRRGASIRHTERLRDVYIGASAIIDHALDIGDTCILSNSEERSTVSGGAAVHHSVLQWGVTVTGNGIVRHAALLEHSGVDQHGMVEHSLIGPNTTIAKGEVTSSLVGPFVGFHHQSLLIAAYWPEGKGNVAYGAMVGSNHTGRAPDQEVWPGEGVFFGLGCSIKFPSDFSLSPYSVIGSGVSTLAQKLRFPFSLIMTPIEAVNEEEVPRAYNELLPGWGFYGNAYGIERMELKYAQRDKSRRHHFHYLVLRPRLMGLVRDALRRLELSKALRPLYLERHIAGVGKNFIREDARKKGIEAYRRALRRYALRILLGEAEGRVTIPGSKELAHQLLDELMPGTDKPARLHELIAIERLNAEIVEKSRAEDDQRGERIIPGYVDAHPAAENDPIVRHAWDRVQSTEERVRKLGYA